MTFTHSCTQNLFFNREPVRFHSIGCLFDSGSWWQTYVWSIKKINLTKTWTFLNLEQEWNFNFNNKARWQKIFFYLCTGVTNVTTKCYLIMHFMFSFHEYMNNFSFQFYFSTLFHRYCIFQWIKLNSRSFWGLLCLSFSIKDCFKAIIPR